MKRDCGRGELIPTKYTVMYEVGPEGEEKREVHIHLNDALARWCAIRDMYAIRVPGSNVRLYAEDKQGYANCILGYTFTMDGKPVLNDRLNELIKP